MLTDLLEAYLDKHPLDFDYCRLAMLENYVFYISNVLEDWMLKQPNTDVNNDEVISGFPKKTRINSLCYFIKNKLMYKLILSKRFSKVFYVWKQLPKQIINNYNSVKAE
ncbi:hypothetical protein [Algibacter sp. L4_22]|uniref:hypothetical protein n=1 Tax=Algibacter sp. L4_22 TaxID=2942477 RepID=UPI00201B86A1|nr:hypothetical protein [Algibacter sp. L4_22]MCL5128744.1 hypothetical protein [Algibacter sp. L4_22]